MANICLYLKWLDIMISGNVSDHWIFCVYWLALFLFTRLHLVALGHVGLKNNGLMECFVMRKRIKAYNIIYLFYHSRP